MKEYKIEKSVFNVGEVEFIRVFFDNGEYIPFGRNEIAGIAVNLYDRLKIYNDDICSVGESGAIELNVGEEPSCIFDDAFVCDKKAYETDRAKYCIDRCLKGGIDFIVLFNNRNWHKSLHGNIIAEKENGKLLLKFLPRQNFGPSKSKFQTICLNDVTADVIDRISVDFENCDECKVYDKEIKEINLELDDKLKWCTNDYGREIKSGYLRIKFRKEYGSHDSNIWWRYPKKSDEIKHIKRRFCKKGLIEAHDICRLYIDYNYAGFGYNRREALEVTQIHDESELRRQWGLKDSESTDDADCYFGGYARRLKDKSILITFGKNAKELMYEQLNRIENK